MNVKRNQIEPRTSCRDSKQKRRDYLLSVIVGAVVASIVGRFGLHRTSAATPLPASKVEVPKFVVDPKWPHIPNGWTLGQVSSAAADADGNIWIIHRTRTVRPGVKTGPPVMEFDAAGNYIQGWGGQSGEGYTWPSTEHGITVDYKGFVWISGNGNDDQILKFTKDGKFVMQIGHAAQKKTTRIQPASGNRPMSLSIQRPTKYSLPMAMAINGSSFSMLTPARTNACGEHSATFRWTILRVIRP